MPLNGTNESKNDPLYVQFNSLSIVNQNLLQPLNTPGFLHIVSNPTQSVVSFAYDVLIQFKTYWKIWVLSSRLCSKIFRSIQDVLIFWKPIKAHKFNSSSTLKEQITWPCNVTSTWWPSTNPGPENAPKSDYRTLGFTAGFRKVEVVCKVEKISVTEFQK